MRIIHVRTAKLRRLARCWSFAALAAGIVFTCTSTGMAALVLLPGASNQPVPSGDAGPAASGGTSFDTQSSPFTSNAGASDFSGTLLSTAYHNDASNPFGPTAVTFEYQITIDPGTSIAPKGFSALSFAFSALLPWTTLVSIETGSSVTAGTVASRDNATSGAVITFTNSSGLIATPALLGPATVETFIVRTNATTDRSSNDSLINGGTASPIAALGPSGGVRLIAVPEPASMIAWGLMGILGLSYHCCRRRSLT